MQLKLFQRLKDQGLNNENASRIIDMAWWDEGEKYLLVTSPDLLTGEKLGHVTLHDHNFANMERLKECDTAIFVNLAKLQVEVEQAIK